MKATITGLENLRKGIAERQNFEPIKRVVKQNGAEFQKRAMTDVPVDTGDLRRSILMHIQNAGFEALITPYLYYAGYVEYGTRFMAAQPYMRFNFRLQAYQFKKDMDKLMGGKP